MVDKALEHYYGILDGDIKANYLRSKKHMVAAEPGASISALWRMHDASIGGQDSEKEVGGRISLLDLKIELANNMLADCRLCERRCGANRSAGMKGHCGVLDAKISSDFIHMGEEPDLIPSYTIFFAGCTFNCVYCQNWDISTRPGSGISMTPSDLARKIELRWGMRKKGIPSNHARNVNWVGGDPTSNLPFILEVLRECHANLPQVWNSNMYLSDESMNLLNGVIDVYLTDYKYGNDKCAFRLSNVPNYTKVCQRNHLLGRKHAEMIVRHLVLPGHVDCCTRPALSWISENLKNVKVNVMSQYRPEHRAKEFADIGRPLKIAEYQEAIGIAERLGLDLCD